MVDGLTPQIDRRRGAVSERLSLRARFVLVALACLLPLLGVVIFVLDRSLEHGRDQLLDTEAAAAQVVAGILAATIEDNQDTLERLAALDEFHTANVDTALVSELLSQFRRARPSLSGLFFLDQQGRIIATSGLDSSQLPSGLMSPLGATLTGEVAVSNRLFTADGDVIAIAVPVWPGDTGEGAPVGAVGALLGVERLSRTVLPFTTSDTQTVIAVVAEDGQIIAAQTTGELDEQELQRGLEEPLKVALSGTVGTHAYRDRSGAERLAAFAPVAVPTANWAVLVTHPAPLTYGPNRALLEQGVVALAIAVVATLVLALVLGEWVARPLRRLTFHAAALTRGEFGRPAPTGGGGEVAQLSTAFSEMSDRLTTQVHDLEVAQQEGARRAEALRDLHRRTVRLQEDERRRIASDIHDAVSPLITGALYQARALRLSNGHGESARDDDLQAVGDLLERAMGELHDVIFALRPPDLDDIGVVAAIERHVAQVQRAGLTCRLDVIGESPPLTPEVRLAIYRIVQEALHNALRHAAADEAVVRLEATDGLLRVTIQDNGAGFDPEATARPNALGLLSMRERATAIGASFAISSRAGDGTRVVVERPLIESDMDAGAASTEEALIVQHATQQTPP